MEYLTVNARNVVRVQEPQWDFFYKSNCVRATIYKHGFFFDIDYLYKEMWHAKVAAIALRTGLMGMPKPVNIIADWKPMKMYRGRMR